jgi:hypothetical protein
MAKAAAKTTKKANTTVKKTKKTASKKVTKKTAKKTAPVKKAPEKEMTKALAVVETKEEPKVETPKKIVKKKIVSRGEIRHILSRSRNGKVQNRLKGTATGVNQWGHKIGSQAAKIDNLIEAGRFSLTEIQTMSGARTKGRLYNHFRALKEAGHPVVNKDKKVKFA